MAAEVDGTDAPDAAATATALWDLPPELEYFRTSEALRVELEAFQGPLDLLLYLIQKDQIDIRDIPIARITDQFLRYLEVIQLLDLANAGDFLVMAATLMRIKTQMLLPVTVEEELDEEDPRAELVRRLLEYKRFKEAAAALQHCADERARLHTRQTPWCFLDEAELPPPRLRFNMYELLAALADVLEKVAVPSQHTVHREPFTIEQKIDRIRERLRTERTVRFHDLFAEDAIRMEIVVTFQAMLELCKRGELRFIQTATNGPIWLQAAEPEPLAVAAEPEPLRALVAADGADADVVVLVDPVAGVDPAGPVDATEPQA